MLSDVFFVLDVMTGDSPEFGLSNFESSRKTFNIES